MLSVTKPPASKPVPKSLLERSRVLQLLWAHRGRRDGLSLTELCALTNREAVAVTAQIAAARSALRRHKCGWHIVEETNGRASIWEPTFWLTSRSCPRPPRRVLKEAEPELISFSDLGDEFPGEQPRFTELLHIAKDFGNGNGS